MLNELQTSASVLQERVKFYVNLNIFRILYLEFFNQENDDERVSLLSWYC